MPEARALHVVVRDLADALGPERLPAQVLAAVPAAGGARQALAGRAGLLLRVGPAAPGVVVERVLAERRQVGDDYIVGMRLSGDEMLEGGLTADDCFTIIRKIVSSGLIDFANVYGGQMSDMISYAMNLPGMIAPSAPFLYLASAVKAEMDIPVFHATRITDLATAARAIE